MSRLFSGSGAVVVVISTIALVVSGLLVWGENLPAGEVEVFRAVNDQPDWLEFVLWGPMQLGQVSAVVVFPTLFYVLTRNRRVALATALLALSAWVGAKGLKHVVERKRPGSYLSDAELREGFAADLGWPSGHVAVIATVVTGLWPWLSVRLRVAGVIAVIAVSVARVYFGAHLPIDVVGGAALGAAAGGVAQLIARKAPRRTPTGTVGAAR